MFGGFSGSSFVFERFGVILRRLAGVFLPVGAPGCSIVRIFFKSRWYFLTLRGQVLFFGFPDVFGLRFVIVFVWFAVSGWDLFLYVFKFPMFLIVPF